MLYLVRKLHTACGEVQRMQVVEVVDGVVRGFSPFDVERQSMLWVEDAFLSPSSCANVLGDLQQIACDASVAGPLFLYSCDCADEQVLCPLLFVTRL